MRPITFYTVVACVLLTVVIDSCKKDNDASPSSSFDKAALAKNIGENIIIPNFQSWNTTVNAMDASIIAFNANPSTTTLTDAQNKFKDAYRAWEKCAVFNFGPAEDVTLGGSVNIFPTNTDKINTNMTSSGNINLDLLTNADAKGFPALDYLLFGTGADNSAIVLKYTTDANATKRKQYLAALSANIKSLSSSVLTAWLPTGGKYITTFETATGTDVGSAVGLLVNGITYDLDVLKNYKIAIPVGITPSSGSQVGVALPQKVEGYYSGISTSLILADLTTLQDIYLGRNSQSNDVGFEEYLTAIDAKYNGGLLNDAITSQMTVALAKVQVLPDPLSNTISTNPTAVKASYTELQKLLVLLKTDMPSALAVQITFEDNDGD